MTHFNHDWDTTETPAVPVSVGDRYYAQDLNDDFNYLKHLPYETFLQGKSCGVMVTPNDTWDNDTNSLTLSGGFGAILQDCIELNPSEDFVIPPKTHSSPRYERIPFVDVTLIIPNGNTTHYIVATPTKRSLLQRTKTLFTEQYASRIRYDGIITIQDTFPTTGQILIGLCNNKEYCLLTDINPNQCKDSIILKKWFGESKITKGFIPLLQYYYNTSIEAIETGISIDAPSGIGVGITFNNCTISINIAGDYGFVGINNGTFNNCTISIDTISGNSGGGGIQGGTFNNCTISIDTISGNSGGGIQGGTFNNCTISINTISGGNGGINGGNFKDCIISIGTISSGNGIGSIYGTFNNCTISIGTISGNNVCGIQGGTFNNCTISINTISGGSYGVGGGNFKDCTISISTTSGSLGSIQGGVFDNCTITVNTISSGVGIGGGAFNNCIISIGTISSGTGIENVVNVALRLTYVRCSAITNLSNTGGKLNILNDTILHAS